MNDLTLEDFIRFYNALHNYEPFPWQKRLVRYIIDHDGEWPDVLSLPTSAGKTSAIDVAVFLLARDAGKSLGERKAALRTFFVVDRRIVVDEAGEHAKRIAGLLCRPPEGSTVLQDIADRLRSFGADKPLHVSVLRGGMYRDGSWAEVPNQPTICLSTVDQVGSRLLFRGYGVGRHQRAVHAGLVGNDSLILLDEAHLSNPFRETLEAVSIYRSVRWAEAGHHLPTPFRAVTMSATARHGGVRFGMNDPAWAEEDAKHPVLKLRLEASKRARLKELSAAPEGKERDTLAAAIAAEATELAGLNPPAEEAKPKRRTKSSSTIATAIAPPANVIGIVVNRVDTARRVYELLKAAVRKWQAIPEDEEDQAVILLTGRIRPYDRDELLFRKAIGEERGWLTFMEAKGDKDLLKYTRPELPRGKLFVVATQTVEVGANLSFDALVTEIAPLDALRQRFGRLDRLGLRRISNAVIVATKDQVAARADDPIYGDRLSATWKQLRVWEKASGKAKAVDFGIAHLPHLEPETLAPLCAEQLSAPVMLPAHVDTWVQTSLDPVPDPDITLFLHGPRSGPADVNVVWRADLTGDLLRDAPAAVNDVVSLVPPTSMEALPLPVWVVKRWLKNQAEAGVADVEGIDSERGAERSSSSRRCKPFLRWCGPEDEDTKVFTDLDMIHPGDTIVVPAEYRGADEFGWNPDPNLGKAVMDVADDCSWRAKRRPVLRVHLCNGSTIHQFALQAWGVPPNETGQTLSAALTAALPGDERSGNEDWQEIERLLGEWPGLPDWWVTAFANRSRRRRIDFPDRAGPGAAFVLPFQPFREDTPAEIDGDAPSAGDESSFTGEPVELAQHCAGVRKEVERLAHAVGLGGCYERVLSRAALVHDIGKADLRFQLWLHGGDERAWASAGAPLAKSGRLTARNRAADRAARRRAGWPSKARHEALSVLMAADNPPVLEGCDAEERDLLLYLIGVHHGHGRPFWDIIINDDVRQRESAPNVECVIDAKNVRIDNDHSDRLFRPELALARIGSGWADRFWQLVRRYGYWGLAYLETLLVLADHRQSKQESRREGSA
jgi:CRISPR-associated endonuclease/helicase Cas3